jgi:hypothetical protein
MTVSDASPGLVPIAVVRNGTYRWTKAPSNAILPCPVLWGTGSGKFSVKKTVSLL